MNSAQKFMFAVPNVSDTVNLFPEQKHMQLHIYFVNGGEGYE